MSRLAAILTFLLVLAAPLYEASAADADTIAAVNASSDALDAAFEKQDAETIKALMTSDHITVAPYYDGPQTVEDQLASLSEYDWQQTIVGDVDVAILAPDVALRTFTADLKGTFQGKTLPSQVFATELLVKRDGKWVERFYQVTTLKP
jgi:ketosteroid isomerase-like protein